MFDEDHAQLEAAIWELFTSEIGHLTSLFVVQAAFLRPLADMQHVGHRHDARVPKDVAKISAPRVGGGEGVWTAHKAVSIRLKTQSDLALLTRMGVERELLPPLLALTGWPGSCLATLKPCIVFPSTP